jgi:hypothetical protein
VNENQAILPTVFFACDAYSASGGGNFMPLALLKSEHIELSAMRRADSVSATSLEQPVFEDCHCSGTSSLQALGSACGGRLDTDY